MIVYINRSQTMFLNLTPQKLLVYIISRSQTMFLNLPSPPSIKRPWSAQKGKKRGPPREAELKTKR